MKFYDESLQVAQLIVSKEPGGRHPYALETIDCIGFYYSANAASILVSVMGR
jgi:hypothetical protein